MCLLAASYEDVFTTARDLVLDKLGKGAEAAVFGDNAVRFYGLGAA